MGIRGYEGAPIAGEAVAGATSAFDAVYSPIKTEFLTRAAAEGLTVITGYELFIRQGIDAWIIFSGGMPVDETRLRNDLAAEGEAP